LIARGDRIAPRQMAGPRVPFGDMTDTCSETSGRFQIEFTVSMRAEENAVTAARANRDARGRKSTPRRRNDHRATVNAGRRPNDAELPGANRFGPTHKSIRCYGRSPNKPTIIQSLRDGLKCAELSPGMALRSFRWSIHSHIFLTSKHNNSGVG